MADGMIARLRAPERDEPGAEAASQAGARGRSRGARPAGGPRLRRLVRRHRVGPATDRADPKDKIELFNLMTEAREVAQRRDRRVRERHRAATGRSLAEDPNVIDALVQPRQPTTRCGRFDEAIAYFKKALALKPDYDLPVINMANVYRQMGRDEAALAGYEHYLTIDPKNAHVRYQIGEIYLDRGDEARRRRRTSGRRSRSTRARRRRSTPSA